jgi:uncharacterized lipoprotein NlpE involved in copper resistance
MFAGLQILISSQLNFCNMKKKILAACFIAAASITFISCDWFKTKSKNANPTIVGKWQVDSLYPIGKDTNSLLYLGYAFAKKDNQPITIQFNADSTYSESDSSHATKQKYYLAKDSIYVQNDASFIAYHLSFKNDSSLQLLSKDSALYILSKK